MDFLGIQKETPAEKQIRALLFDDMVQVLSSFELNQVASLTYGDLVCDQIFEIIEDVVAQPLNYTPLSIQKSLIITKHILIYGSEKCVNSAYGISKFMAALQEFNTVLMAQKQKGALAMLQRIQGGGVDKGGPVREAATAVCQLLVNIDELRKIRNSSADPNSLVPIGDDRVAFVTDEVRLYLLKQRIDEQHRIMLKSNLAKSAGSFGGGYNSSDGKTVVGAAHGIEEMLKMATKHTSQFSDDANGAYNPDAAILAELAAEHKAAKRAQAKADKAADLLLNPPAPPKPKHDPNIDLLDFGGGGGEPNVTTTSDLLGDDFFGATPSGTTTGNLSDDLLGLSLGHTEVPGATTTQNIPHHDPFGLISEHAQNDPSDLLGSPGAFGAETSAPHQNGDQSNLLGTPGDIDVLYAAPASNSMLSGVKSMFSGMGLSRNNNNNTTEPKKAVMGSNEDRFAALDVLTPGGGGADDSGPTITMSQSIVQHGSLTLAKSPFDSLSMGHSAVNPPPMSISGQGGLSSHDTFLSGAVGSPPMGSPPQPMGGMGSPPMGSPPPPMPPPPPPMDDLPPPPMSMPPPPPPEVTTTLPGVG